MFHCLRRKTCANVTTHKNTTRIGSQWDFNDLNMLTQCSGKVSCKKVKRLFFDGWQKRMTIFWLLLFILPFCWTYWPILEGARNSNFWYFGYFSLTGMRTMVETLFVHFPLQSLSGDYMFSLFASASIIQGDVRLWRDSQTWLNHCRLHVTLVAVQNRRSLPSAAKYERNTWFRCKSLVALFTQISDLGSWAR